MDSLAYYDIIIGCFEKKYFDPVGMPFFKSIEVESVWTLNMLPKEHVIAISFSNPYYINYYFQNVPVLINAYSSDVFIQDAVVKALAREIVCVGQSSV